MLKAINALYSISKQINIQTHIFFSVVLTVFRQVHF